MGLFRRNPSSAERLPAFIPTSCIGEACPNYGGASCENPEMEWMTAGGPTKGRDTTKPPLRSEASYIIYRQRCLAGAAPELVAQKVQVLDPENVNMARLIAITGTYGDMPVSIIQGDTVSQVETIARSD